MPSLIRSWSSSREIALLAVISRNAARICVALFMASVGSLIRAGAGPAGSPAAPPVHQVRLLHLGQREAHLLAAGEPQRHRLLRALAALQPQQLALQPPRLRRQRAAAAHRHLLPGEAPPVARAGERA